MKITFVVAMLAVLCVMTAMTAEAKKQDRYFWVYSWSVKKVDKVIVTATYNGQTKSIWFSHPAFGYFPTSQVPWFYKQECQCWIRYHYTQFEFNAPDYATFNVCVKNAISGKQNCALVSVPNIKNGINLEIP